MVLDYNLMTPTVRTEDLVDARWIAEFLGLTHPNSVSTYQKRYSDMPRPVINLGSGRCRLWRRSEVIRWAQDRNRT